MHFDININELISQYGYIPILIGCIAEGEILTILGGMAIHEDLLTFRGVFFTAMVGGIIGDQLLFWLGYNFGPRIINHLNKKHHKVIDKTNILICKYPVFFIIGVRFIYGFRIIGPIIIGACRLNALRFFILNILGAALWAWLFVTLGYFAGKIIIPYIHKFNEYIRNFFWTSLIIMLFFFIIYNIIRSFNRNNIN